MTYVLVFALGVVMCRAYVQIRMNIARKNVECMVLSIEKYIKAKETKK